MVSVFFFQWSNSESWMSPCNFARFSQPCTTTVKYLRTFIQQEGTPCKYASNVRRLLNDVFTDKWIGWAGPVVRPSLSPLLTPLGYFIWGDVKTVVFPSKPHSLYEFKIRIINAFHETQRICSEMVYGFEWRVLNDGGHIEGWNFEMCCLKAIKLRFYTGCLCQCTFKIIRIEI